MKWKSNFEIRHDTRWIRSERDSGTSPPIGKFAMENRVKYTLQKSVQGHVYLTKANLDTEGIYRCEASAESPTFQTAEAEKPLKVFVIPQEDPEIVGSQSRYEVGEHVNVTCKSGPSKPAAVLKWYINGKEAEASLEISYPVVDHTNGLQTSLLGLYFMVKPKDLFQGGAITLKCTATVSQTYSTSSEELIVGEKFVGTAPAMNTLTVVAKDGPLITGGETQYRVGQVLNLNCSSAKSRPAPQLQWYLNEKQVIKSHLIRYPVTFHVDGDVTSVLGLRMLVRPDDLDDNGEVRLKCTATLSRVINVRSDERTLGGNHRNSGLQVAENFGKVSERSSCSSQLTFHSMLEMMAVSTLLVLL
ncbi:hypothetical protein JTE90_023915 [Oedothorax gibbosus]|uniref:Ig-like domain-containing protein n=1 Tax=Oedothorax gibbosus TaxID=931172 RepID=A0AAV6UM53_9ARAC|nr:hypothetical protein JTE90_023915 [Oedothorax gibbosus]